MRNTGEISNVILLFVLWYFFGSAANIYCKQFLSIYERPVILTLGQYCMGIMITSGYLLLQPIFNSPAYHRDHFDKKPHSVTLMDLSTLSSSGRKQLLFVCVVNGLGHLMTNFSMNSVAVSFTHTIKAAEPLFSVFLSVMILKQKVSGGMYCSLFPIVFGIILATTTELSYTHFGMITAMLSNAMFSSRNTISKKLQYGNKLNNWVLFWCLSVSGAFLMLFFYFLSTFGGTTVVPNESGWWSLLIASICHCIYNLVSFMILSKVAPLSHAIGNAMRRLVIIYCAVIWFRTPVSFLNITGTIIACIGVLCYSRASQLQSQQVKRYEKKDDDFLSI